MLHRQILSTADLEAFSCSPARASILQFINDLNASVSGCKNSQALASPDQPLIEWSLSLIEEATASISQFPPADRGSEVNRFGSPAFRAWQGHLQTVILPKKVNELKATLVDKEYILEEAERYLANAVGSNERIDYGTGHELHFLLFMYCVGRLQVNCSQSFLQSLVLKVFRGYIRLMSELQQTYWLEPAGSHGVWGLDDYHFLPFLFGAAQLQGNTQIRPKAINSPELVEWLAPEYIYFEMINRILRVKASLDAREFSLDSGEASCSLRWLSPVLDDIAAVKNWEKITSGLVKMYEAEVLGKLPIMQHCLFGQVINFTRLSNEDSIEESVSSNTAAHYTHSKQGDCCGNPLPSIFSAAAKQKPKAPQPGLPFD